MNGKRLKQLRLARGLSLDALAGEMGGAVTKQALSKYETGKTNPTPPVLNKLASALGVKAAFLQTEPEIAVEFIAYRKGSGLPKKEQSRIESTVRQTLEERVRLEDLTALPPSDLPVQEFKIRKVSDAEAAAAKLRERWMLGSDVISSVVGVLEDHLVHVIEIEAPQKFDGLSAIAYRDNGDIASAAVITRKRLPGERQRFDLAHELGHQVMKIPRTVDAEKAAFRFASSFLAPEGPLVREVGERRTLLRLEELLLLKRRFGISLQALLYRMNDLGIITESYYKQWCVDINRLGWKKREPGELPSERPQWLRQNVLRAFSEGVISRQHAEQMLGDSIEVDEPLSLVERRAFMNLSLEERRRILAEQAERFEKHYGETLR